MPKAVQRRPQTAMRKRGVLTKLVRIIAPHTNNMAKAKHVYEKARIVVRFSPKSSIHHRSRNGYKGTLPEKKLLPSWAAQAVLVKPIPRLQRTAGSDNMTSSPQGIGLRVAVRKFIPQRDIILKNRMIASSRWGSLELSRIDLVFVKFTQLP